MPSWPSRMLISSLRKYASKHRRQTQILLTKRNNLISPLQNSSGSSRTQVAQTSNNIDRRSKLCGDPLQRTQWETGVLKKTFTVGKFSTKNNEHIRELFQRHKLGMVDSFHFLPRSVAQCSFAYSALRQMKQRSLQVDRHSWMRRLNLITV